MINKNKFINIYILNKYINYGKNIIKKINNY